MNFFRKRRNLVILAGCLPTLFAIIGFLFGPEIMGMLVAYAATTVASTLVGALVFYEIFDNNNWLE